MGLRNVAKAAVVATAVAAAGVSLTAQPASAATTVDWYSAQGQFDNNPGNGAASWVWVYAGPNTSAAVEYQYYNGATGRVTANTWGAASANLGQDIWRIRVCVLRLVATSCSNWT
ncbi:hypothetical protein JOL79_03920 [Microbispora sp. RL4-1S]|uniref:Uncharacterized protein n=1 Tax=Microbispora oryzae TaxID=2806554 RepID=A0A940WHQ3_9ACTN|nr:hypothetical protein [Microbispora oryzae]MBP2702948.1 hypothetical protein [Microbispora oryzae]